MPAGCIPMSTPIKILGSKLIGWESPLTSETHFYPFRSVNDQNTQNDIFQTQSKIHQPFCITCLDMKLT